jgi:hypothetical protein
MKTKPENSKKFRIEVRMEKNCPKVTFSTPDSNDAARIKTMIMHKRSKSFIAWRRIFLRSGIIGFVLAGKRSC